MWRMNVSAWAVVCALIEVAMAHIANTDMKDFMS